MNEEELSNIDKNKQDIASAIAIGILIIGGGVFTGTIWLIILSIIRG